MANGTLHVAWLNRGESGEAHYHVMYGISGANATLKAKSILGQEKLKIVLTTDLTLGDANVAKVFSDLDKNGTSSVPNLDIQDGELRKLELI